VKVDVVADAALDTFWARHGFEKRAVRDIERACDIRVLVELGNLAAVLRAELFAQVDFLGPVPVDARLGGLCEAREVKPRAAQRDSLFGHRYLHVAVQLLRGGELHAAEARKQGSGP
jgi:hypothetical protein